jgi:2-keto-myo-inositol isomerase
MKLSRRKALSVMAMGVLGVRSSIVAAGRPAQAAGRPVTGPVSFRYCLNTSTVSGKNPGLHRYIEIASRAGYHGIEIWVRDLEAALDAGHTLSSLSRFVEDHGLVVENAIGFAPWMAPGEAGFEQMEREMHLLAGIGCRRIAAPPAGVSDEIPLDLFEAGERYSRLLELGRQTGVMPQLEFWGSSPVLWHLGQVLMIAAVADDPDVKILPDIYHMFRGGSGFHTLDMMSGSLIDVFHMNDYPAAKPREQQDDSDRVYPGDGAAPIYQILNSLRNMGGEKILSLELFNRNYWEEDPVAVAQRGLLKMKSLVGELV